MKYGSGATVDSVLWGLAARTNGLTCGACGCAQWPGAAALALDRVQPSAKPPCAVAVRGSCCPWTGVSSCS